SPYHFTQYGGSVGGPIVRDKHFFFANVDAQRNSIPNDTFLAGTIPADAVSQATAAFLAPLAVPYSQNQNQNVFLLKTDSELTNANHLSVRFNRQTFTGVYTFNSLADFPNKPPSYLQNFPGPGTDGGTTHPDLTDIAFFIGDEWRITPALTFNAGLRYDRQNFAQPKITNPDAQLIAAGLDTGRIHEDGNNYGPRLGFAWTPGNDGRTVVHGGFGIFYGRTPAIMIGTGH